jgi:dipeptidyl aminopeptidase/acylaminoacyl peptidase
VEIHLLPESPHGFIRFPHRMARQVLAHAHAWITRKL